MTSWVEPAEESRRGEKTGRCTHLEQPVVDGVGHAVDVRAVGPGVLGDDVVAAGPSGLSVGDVVAAVTGAGGLAEVVIADAALTVPVPDGVALERAAAAPGALMTAALLLEQLAARSLDFDVEVVGVCITPLQPSRL